MSGIQPGQLVADRCTIPYSPRHANYCLAQSLRRVLGSSLLVEKTLQSVRRLFGSSCLLLFPAQVLFGESFAFQSSRSLHFSSLWDLLSSRVSRSSRLAFGVRRVGGQAVFRIGAILVAGAVTRQPAQAYIMAWRLAHRSARR